MKLTYEDKVQIYELRNQGQTFNQLSKRFGVDASGLRYMTRLIERYGIEIVKKGKNCYYSPELKQEMIDKVRISNTGQFTFRAEGNSDLLVKTFRFIELAFHS